jgi:hypothetical protein
MEKLTLSEGDWKGYNACKATNKVSCYYSYYRDIKEWTTKDKQF